MLATHRTRIQSQGAPLICGRLDLAEGGSREKLRHGCTKHRILNPERTTKEIPFELLLLQKDKLSQPRPHSWKVTKRGLVPRFPDVLTVYVKHTAAGESETESQSIERRPCSVRCRSLRTGTTPSLFLPFLSQLKEPSYPYNPRPKYSHMIPISELEARQRLCFQGTALVYLMWNDGGLEDHPLLVRLGIQ